jgi:hypothetical protein
MSLPTSEARTVQVARLIGSNVVERAGSVLAVAGLLWLLQWLLAAPYGVMENFAARHVVDGLVCISDCRYGYESWRPLKLIELGVFMRFAALPIWRWLRTGQLRR